MRATIDKAGRLVIPKLLRDQLGLRPGEVEVSPDGNALRVEVVTQETLVSEGRWLVIPGPGPSMSVEDVQALRDADQR